MTLLSAPVALHASSCVSGGSCRCGPVRDVETFVRSVVRAHHRGGPGPEGGRATDDLVCDLFVVLSELAAVPLPGGWAGRPFADYAIWKLHREIIDWYRKRFPGSRYGRALLFVANGEAKSDTPIQAPHISEEDARRERELLRRRLSGFHDPIGLRQEPSLHPDDGDGIAGIDVDALSESARWTLFALAVPLAREGLSVREVAHLSRPAAEEHPKLRSCRGNREWIVERLLRELRAELASQGVGPAVRVESPAAVDGTALIKEAVGA